MAVLRWAPVAARRRIAGLVVAWVLSLPGAVRADEQPVPALWLGVALQQDLPIVSGRDVCSKDSQLERGFACFRASGSQYHGTPVPGLKDQLNPGLVLGTTRLALAGDYAVAEALTLGGRVGYALRGGGPAQDGGRKFLPFHLEARAAYWLTESAHARRGVQPYLLANGGLAQIDGAATVTVVEDPNAPPPPNQPDNPPTQQLDVYKKMGSGFVGVGAGVFLPVAPDHGPSLELGFLGLFPSSGTAVVLSLGYGFGV